MTTARAAFVAALLLVAGPAFAQSPPAGASGVIAVSGKVKQPVPITLEALKKLPAEKVPLQAERGGDAANYAGPRLWAVLQAAGGLDDADKSAPLHYTVKITGSDGYFVIVSTGELSPEFGDKPVIIAYRRDDKPIEGSGYRLVLQATSATAATSAT